MIAAAFAPEPVIVSPVGLSSQTSTRTSSAARCTSPTRENPLLGYRGAARYVPPEFRACFDMECEALRRVRDEMGLTNVADHGAVRAHGRRGDGRRRPARAERPAPRRERTQVVMMCELPANAILAERSSSTSTASRSARTTDSADPGPRPRLRAHGIRFDERDPAVLHPARHGDRRVPATGQVRRHLRTGTERPPRLRAVARGHRGIQSLSLNPDTVVETWLAIAAASGQGRDPGAGAPVGVVTAAGRGRGGVPARVGPPGRAPRAAATRRRAPPTRGGCAPRSRRPRGRRRPP